MSIFNKICPRCAGENPVTGNRCQCGFVFDASANTGSFEALEIDVQEAEVYAEYLQVRMHQAKEIAEVAIAEQARSPKDTTKSSIAAEANAEFNAAKTEYDEQMVLVAQLRRESRATKDAETSKAQAAARANAEQIAKAKKLQPAASSVKAKNTGKGKPNNAAAKAIKPAQSAPADAKPVAVSKPAGGQASPPPAMRKKMADTANSAAQRSRAQQAVQKPVSVQAKKASPAPRVEKPNRPQLSPKSAGNNHQKPSPQLTANEKECPNCTAVVPMNTQECKCGFGFAQGAEKMEGIGLSEADRALLQMFRPASGS